MTQQLIRAALETRLKTWADARPITVAWENSNFAPPAGAYLRANLLPNLTEMRDLQGRHRGYFGIFQITACLPIGVGPAAAQAIAAELDAQFSTETPISSGGITVFITRPMSAAPAFIDDNRYLVPISCEYRCNTIA